MKKFLVFLLLSFLTAQKSVQPFVIDVRPRLVNDFEIQVVIQINNNTGRAIQELEGFIFEYDNTEKILREDRLTLIESYEPALLNGSVISRQKKYHYSAENPKTYSFQISKIRFSEDYRIYTYHPKVGFFRID